MLMSAQKNWSALPPGGHGNTAVQKRTFCFRRYSHGLQQLDNLYPFVKLSVTSKGNPPVQVKEQNPLQSQVCVTGYQFYKVLSSYTVGINSYGTRGNTIHESKNKNRDAPMAGNLALRR